MQLFLQNVSPLIGNLCSELLVCLRIYQIWLTIKVVPGQFYPLSSCFSKILDLHCSLKTFPNQFTQFSLFSNRMLPPNKLLALLTLSQNQLTGGPKLTMIWPIILQWSALSYSSPHSLCFTLLASSPCLECARLTLFSLCIEVSQSKVWVWQTP